jgi:hypothetical protein
VARRVIAQRREAPLRAGAEAAVWGAGKGDAAVPQRVWHRRCPLVELHE